MGYSLHESRFKAALMSLSGGLGADPQVLICWRLSSPSPRSYFLLIGHDSQTMDLNSRWVGPLLSQSSALETMYLLSARKKQVLGSVWRTFAWLLETIQNITENKKPEQFHIQIAFKPWESDSAPTNHHRGATKEKLQWKKWHEITLQWASSYPRGDVIDFKNKNTPPPPHFTPFLLTFIHLFTLPPSFLLFFFLFSRHLNFDSSTTSADHHMDPHVILEWRWLYCICSLSLTHTHAPQINRAMGSNGSLQLIKSSSKPLHLKPLILWELDFIWVEP